MKSLLFTLFLCTCALALNANNIRVSNVALVNQIAVNGSVEIQFDLSWENSWRLNAGPANWDAAWVFVKYTVNGGPWRNMSLNDFTPGSSEADGYLSSDLSGVMLYRRSDGSGNIDWTDNRLKWNYRSFLIDDNAAIEVKVFAVEMVYVPTGQFLLGVGDGGEETNNFHRITSFSNPTKLPLRINSEDEIGTDPASASSLRYDGGGDGQGPIPAAFPKGFAGFYCMKYEVSQQQWVDFFNTLNPSQKANLDITGPAGKNTDAVVGFNGVSWVSGSEATTSLPHLPVNYIPNDFFYAYLSWSGLRPMTELEFEKAARGKLESVPGEYVWGTTRIFNGTYFLNGGDPNTAEINNPGVAVGNAAYHGSGGFLYRCGIFAASAVTANREETGGSYYGIMELSGSVFERTISVGNPGSRAYSGNNGAGGIDEDGRSVTSGWPNISHGFSYRGGSRGEAAASLLTSDRTYGLLVGESAVPEMNGIRGARTPD